MTAQMRGYGVAICIEDGDHHIYVRDLPEVVTAGDTREEALAMAADAIAVALAGRVEDGMSVPEPSLIAPGEVEVRVPA